MLRIGEEMGTRRELGSGCCHESGKRWWWRVAETRMVAVTVVRSNLIVDIFLAVKLAVFADVL